MLAFSSYCDGFDDGNTVVTFVDLVEHPGGHDGGEFPQEHSYVLKPDGGVVYVTDSPSCSTDAFADERAYEEVDTREGAISLLEDRLDQVRAKERELIALVDALRKPENSFEVVNRGNDWEEDDEEDEDDDDFDA